MTRSLGAFGCLAGAMVMHAPAAAQVAEPNPTGFELGIRIGYARPFGERVAGEPLDRTFSSALPVVLDAGYRVTPHLYVGGLISYAPLAMNKYGLGCNTQVSDGPGDCSGSAIRIAADAQWRMSIGDGYAGWLGAGFGVERLSIDYESGCFDGPFSSIDSGFELAHVEAGAGMQVNTGLVIGPFASYSVGLFRTSKTTGSCNGGGEIPDKTVNGLLTLGLRAMYTVPWPPGR